MHAAGNSTSYYKCQLLRGGDGWRISHLSAFLDPPDKPLIDPAAAEALLLQYLGYRHI